MKIKRRDFLKLTAAAGATAALTGCGTADMNALKAAGSTKNIGEAPGQWLPTTCQGCTTWCPVEVFVQDGRAVKVRGNRYSKQNDGNVCPRGHLSLQQLYDPDRIKLPMKRTNPKKGRNEDPMFVPISWDEALNTIADKMMELRTNSEPEKFCLMRGRYTYHRDVIYDVLPKVFGSPNNISHSSTCAEAEKFGSYYTEGYWDYRDYDIDNARYILIWGCDPVASNRMVPAAIKRLGNALDRATVAAVDPRLTTSAAKAQEWLPLQPGTDGALALGIAHVILTDGGWDRDFVGDFKDGFNRFKPGAMVDEADFVEKETYGLVKWWNLAVKDMTAAKAAEISGVPAEQIIRVARGLAAAAPNVCVWMGPGAAMHARGGYSGMAVHALGGLVGGIDNVGGSLQTAKIPVNKLDGDILKKHQDELAKKHTKKEKIDQRGRLELPTINKGKSGGGVSTNNAPNGIINKDPYEIKMLVGYMNNFVFSSNGTDRWEKALSMVPFTVHLTTHASEFSMFSDILLPCAISKYERHGFLKTKANRYATCTIQQPVVQPIWQVIEDETEFPFLIAEKLKERGFSNLHDCLVEMYADPETGAAPKTAQELSLNALKYYTKPLWDGKKDTHGDTINGWNEMLSRGMWNSEPYAYKSHWGGKFSTETKKFEFYSETLKKALTAHAERHKVDVDTVMEKVNYTARGEMAFVPHHEPPLRHGSEAEYPLLFIDYKSRLNREGRSQNAPWYYEFKHVDPGDVGGQDTLRLHPTDATQLGIKDGDRVRITSMGGSGEAVARVWEGVRPGTVSKSYGQGHWAYGRTAASDFAKGTARGINNNTIIPWELERLSGSNARNGGHAAVRVEKI
ncbi:molybdopterin-dependent oxidoreductase [Desulfofustis glycolicus]|uniref:Tat (Twin-arginine translocation) pathway signal sequence n=1 Tax=Desulfofustis glycolicus DSM 9705 TaxID=1121409 RepID=A0A1M5T0B7_9BACT|nr:molybdopterin-dependent oxidoreductase [Desulfofustis glycolicus]MCB2215288.1 molybdopterin-dependent oxidoreductase [Desulfobulbaceae bacterium]SHH44048.1 Tat (twin-arginine translocation) pathway signal sequence [Desulfofustis glycolicus DSM 9705]